MDAIAHSVGLESVGKRERARLGRVDGSAAVSGGPRVLFRFDEADSGMRNLQATGPEGAGMAESVRILRAERGVRQSPH